MTAKDAGIRMSFSEELQPAKLKVVGVGGGMQRRESHDSRQGGRRGIHHCEY